MPNTDSTRYTFVFATVVCVVCALMVAVSAVGLKQRQDVNAVLYRQKNVLLAAGLVKPEDELSQRELLRIFAENIQVRLVDLAAGRLVPIGQPDPVAYDQRRARQDPEQSRVAPPNSAGVSRLPTYGTVYFVMKDGNVRLVVLPIEGVGMWGTLYGFIALEPDGNTIRGLTYYDQKETPGLGGEVSNPRWQALWNGRKVYDASWEPTDPRDQGQGRVPGPGCRCRSTASPAPRSPATASRGSRRSGCRTTAGAGF